MSDYTPRLKTKYYEEVLPALVEKFEYSSKMQAPILEKITINMGLGSAKEEANRLESAVTELTVITGQQAVITKAKKAISNFKLRAGDPVGVKVTLHGKNMWEFLDRLIAIALPRVRDFNGIPNRSFDGRGNYTFGVKEQIIFPEIDYDKIIGVNGMDVSFTTSANTDEEAYELLHALGLPFRRKQV
ncbi:MAG: 50S ribosomal protein L5 [Candidatus Marinimicrobia bacterium]|nr:50S ribosomal protein L5 [Candidatus Neomarinimicrobiota bacterium]MCF7851494.1 50S ribosomal protein L5 [Candidatus Neomarinimicrobiota bacterium]